MNKIFGNPDRSLVAKLIIAIGVLMVIVSFIFWYAILQKQQQDIRSIAVKYGDSFLAFIKQSTHYSMLTLDSAKTQEAVEHLSSPDVIKEVNIYDHGGTIHFSSNEERISSTVVKTSLACTACHEDPEKSSALLNERMRWNVTKDPQGVSSLSLVSVIENEKDCYTARCHVHPQDQKIIGFIKADFSLGLLDVALHKQKEALSLYVAIFVIIVSLFVGFIIYTMITRPIRVLIAGMERIAGGDLDHSVPITSDDEMGVLARSFNAMIKDLKEARDQREKWTQTLEEEVARKTEEIRKTHASLVQTEKLASLGRMAAGVAHEINNPLTGVITFAHLLRDRFPDKSQEVDDLNVIIEQSERCSKIISNLLTFARATPSEKGSCDINEVLSRTVFMLKNQEKFHHIKFDVEMDEAQFIVFGDASQFQQIFLNMFINAADAMEKRGKITVASRRVKEKGKDFVEIEFSDEGCGIKEEDMSKLFEPFFTTKPIGKGTGLGLSVSHGIVKHFGGTLKVESTVGKGTSFFVRLPLSETHQ
ncbi:MAG: hypothetical protein AMK70_05365 [Nitrospira bacterium SG8_35_1]|nr:MAG: hypothetical protein AMK70_05365 [Nitrospira bacterium SG8_35_1]